MRALGRKFNHLVYRNFRPEKYRTFLHGQRPEQREIARASGMSDVEYARALIELQNRKRADLIQDAG
jgi:hypothetical protein